LLAVFSRLPASIDAMIATDRNARGWRGRFWLASGRALV
jgi:hypothetical protein